MGTNMSCHLHFSPLSILRLGVSENRVYSKRHLYRVQEAHYEVRDSHPHRGLEVCAHQLLNSDHSSVAPAPSRRDTFPQHAGLLCEGRCPGPPRSLGSSSLMSSPAYPGWCSRLRQPRLRLGHRHHRQSRALGRNTIQGLGKCHLRGGHWRFVARFRHLRTDQSCQVQAWTLLGPV